MTSFMAVVEAGSFIAAADAARLSKAAVSRHVADLEERLGVRLLQRTTRRLSLTDDGQTFFARAKELLAAIEEAESEVTARTGESYGLLRVNAPLTFGVLHLAPVWGRFAERYPRVSLDVTLSDRVVARYRLGWKLFQLGERAAVQFDLRPFLKRLRDLTGQSSLLSVPLNGEALVITAADNDRNVSITVRPGNRPAPHCSAQGRIALAWATEVQRERLLGERLRALTPHSLTEPGAVQRRLERIRERLYEEAPNESLVGINVLAAPVLREGEELVGIVGMIGSIQEVKSPPDARQFALVRGCAVALSEVLGSGAYRARGVRIPKELNGLARSRA